MKRITKSKRFWITLIFAVLGLGIFTIGILNGVEAVELGTGLALLMAPVYVYIAGESMRPSVKRQLDAAKDLYNKEPNTGQTESPDYSSGETMNP